MFGVHRLSVMWIKTTSLSAPSLLITPHSKDSFYIFHVLPKWLASLILFGNIRISFGTGLIWRPWDVTEKERVKRLDREAKRETKRKEEKSIWLIRMWSWSCGFLPTHAFRILDTRPDLGIGCMVKWQALDQLPPLLDQD
jgi:hypothetical protein